MLKKLTALVLGLAIINAAFPVIVTSQVSNANVRLVGSSANALNNAIPDPCTTSAKTPYPINIASGTTTVVQTASASNKFRVCSIILLASLADNVALVEDATGSCASPDAGLMGGTTTGSGLNLVANEGLTFGNGLGTIAQTASTNVNVCLITSSSAQLSGTIMGVLAP